MIACCYHDL